MNNIGENLENYLKKPYSRILIPDDESGTFTAEILEFPGCIAQGDTAQEAYERLEEAAKAWIEAALELGQEIPPPSLAHGYGGKVALRLPKKFAPPGSNGCGARWDESEPIHGNRHCRKSRCP